MKTIEVSTEGKYSVKIDCSWAQELELLLKGRVRAAIIVSSAMRPILAELASMDCEVIYFEIPDGEAGKSTKSLLQLWDWLGAAGFTRSDIVIGIGGGAVTDIAGYAAATWLRGIDWIAIPTTVAGMVDASIGGKTGINSDYGKNLIGSFHSPIAVLIDISWLPSLSDRDFAAGLAEVVKCGFISDPEILELVSNTTLAQLRENSQVMTELIYRSVAVKAAVVSEDFKESFAREVLNYGHTLGHAVETHSKYSLRHGECVSIGMVYVAQLAVDLGLMKEDVRKRQIDILTQLDLPTTYQRAAWPALLATMSLDKKSRGKVLRFVIVSEVAKTQRLEGPDISAMAKAYEKVSS